jgi:hypothetical protein
VVEISPCVKAMGEVRSEVTYAINLKIRKQI